MSGNLIALVLLFLLAFGWIWMEKDNYSSMILTPTLFGIIPFIILLVIASTFIGNIPSWEKFILFTPADSWFVGWFVLAIIRLIDVNKDK